LITNILTKESPIPFSSNQTLPGNEKFPLDQRRNISTEIATKYLEVFPQALSEENGSILYKFKVVEYLGQK
jgi:hypothetical protein